MTWFIFDRKFDGKKFHLEGVRKTKAEAQNLAERLRKEGFLARVTMLPATVRFLNKEGKWAVYVRQVSRR